MCIRDRSSTVQDAITGVFEGKNLESIVASAAGLDGVTSAISEQLTDVVKQVVPDLSSELADGIQNTLSTALTQVTLGSDLSTALDNALGGALIAEATKPPEDEVDADTIVDEETLDAMFEAETGAEPTVDVEAYQDLADSLGEAGLTNVGDLGDIIGPDIDTTPLPQPTGDGPIGDPPTITPEGDPPVISDIPPELGDPEGISPESGYTGAISEEDVIDAINLSLIHI